MKYGEILDNLVKSGNGYLLTSEAYQIGMSRTTLSEYVKDRHMERIAQGLYIAENAWPDEMYEVSVLNKRAVFSHETALHLHGLMEREPGNINVTVYAGYNATHLRKRGIKVYQVKQDIAELGIINIDTNLGNPVRVFDMDRTICDVVACKNNMDIQVFRYAIREYMSSKKKNLGNLMSYAKKLNVETDVRLYTEVMI